MMKGPDAGAIAPAAGAGVDNRMVSFRCSRRFAVLFAALLWIGLGLPAGAQDSGAQDSDGFVGGVADLPLMPGLAEMPDRGLIFDKPGGRIVEAYAAGAVAPGAVASFYDTTLPQLGWQRDRSGGYLREGERLELTLTEAAGLVTVQFRLFPQ